MRWPWCCDRSSPGTSSDGRAAHCGLGCFFVRREAERVPASPGPAQPRHPRHRSSLRRTRCLRPAPALRWEGRGRKTTPLSWPCCCAYPSGPVQRRTIHAAEQSLRATLLLVVGIALSAAVFFWLPAAPPTMTFKPLRTGLIATLLSAPSILLFGFAAWLYVGALQTLLPPMITSLGTKLRYRRELERRKR